jgi:seryl-tRNA synthetase
MGHRGYFLQGWGFKLSQALIRLALGMLEEGYTIIQTSCLVTREQMAKTAQLSDFDEMLYHVDGGHYLAATAEQPLSVMHAGEWLEPRDLPIRYGGLSTCFRKEAGSGGRDEKGIFRVHQFDKVEQFALAEPNKSWEEHQRMLRIAEKFYQALEIPYRVVDIVSGALNDAAARKYDLEGWFPGERSYRELVSCSNCTSYQSRALEIRCGYKEEGEQCKKYVHLLNSTMMANTRTICCLLENYQSAKGIIVPKVLRADLGVDFIPFVTDGT